MRRGKPSPPSRDGRIFFRICHGRFNTPALKSCYSDERAREHARGLLIAHIFSSSVQFACDDKFLRSLTSAWSPMFLSFLCPPTAVAVIVVNLVPEPYTWESAVPYSSFLFPSDSMRRVQVAYNPKVEGEKFEGKVQESRGKKKQLRFEYEGAYLQ